MQPGGADPELDPRSRHGPQPPRGRQMVTKTLNKICIYGWRRRPLPHWLPILSLPILSGRWGPHPTPTKGLAPALAPAPAWCARGLHLQKDEEITFFWPTTAPALVCALRPLFHTTDLHSTPLAHPTLQEAFAAASTARSPHAPRL